MRKTRIPTIGSFARRAKSLLTHPAFGLLTVLGNGTILTGAFVFYSLEKSINPHLQSPLDALWWAVAAVTTVGFGNILPTTAAGKWLGIFLMIFGSATFASFTALFASVLLKPDIDEVESEMRHIEKTMENLKQEFDSEEQILERASQELMRAIQALKDKRGSR